MGNFSNKNVNVTTTMFLMSGDLTGLCLYMSMAHNNGMAVLASNNIIAGNGRKEFRIVF